MNICMVTSEALPFSKTGGLADVAYSLSKEFVSMENNVSIISPLYKKRFNFDKYKLIKVYEFNVRMNWRNEMCEVFHYLYEGIDYFFISNDRYFNRDNSIYGYYDDGERFAYFQNATVILIDKLPFKIDICHCHDWEAGMVPCLIKTNYNYSSSFKKLRTILTIHNPLFKGYLGRDSLYDLFNLPTSLYDNGDVRLENQVSTLKAGIKFADKITTVSPTHAKELLTIDGSKGLWYDLILRQNDFIGILNGMDYKEFNPSNDNLIYVNYDESNYLEKKKENKIKFCNEHGLDPSLPLFSVISRLTSQKGLDLIYQMASFLIKEGGNFAILGSGEFKDEEMFNNLYRFNPKHTFVYIGYSDEIAHKLYASSDFLIMPSAFEPCGLSQMIAHRYATLPIVRRTGGLKDSVICYHKDLKNEDTANGFGFDDYNNIEAIKCTLNAINVYENNIKTFNRLTLNAIKTDHTWTNSAKEYLDLYKLALSYNNL